MKSEEEVKGDATIVEESSQQEEEYEEGQSGTEEDKSVEELPESERVLNLTDERIKRRAREQRGDK